MFTTERVPCYLHGFGGHGDDPENKELKLVFHLSFIPYSLANEVSSTIASRLFVKGGENDQDWIPVKELNKANFNSQIPLQNITFSDLPAGELGGNNVMIPSCAISNLRAAKATAESRDFRLEFDVVIPMDDLTMDLVEKYYKATVYLTTAPVQRTLAEGEGVIGAELGDALQRAADSTDDGKSAGAGERKRGRRKKNTSAEESELEPAEL